MGFTFHKLYPAIYPTGIDCCNVNYTCPCVLGCSESRGTTNLCQCPAFVVTQPCGAGEICGGLVCPGTITYTSNFPAIELGCIQNNTLTCICRSYTFTWCDGPCENDDRTCCPRNECFTFYYNFGDSQVATRKIFDQCIVSGAGPKTYRIENVNGATSSFACKFEVSSGATATYETVDTTDSPPVKVIRGDPAFTTNNQYQRFYKTPTDTAGRTVGATAAFSSYCLQLHSTDSQTKGIENRVMFISGRNVYRYTGPLSGDPTLLSLSGSSDPFWNSGGIAGVTGIKQYEESISGRTFPLPDSTLTLPLWGQTANNNLGLPDDPNSCVSPYDECFDGVNTNLMCRDCKCVQSNAFSQTGHYLSTEHFGSSSGRGYTAGYFSFAEFNPHCYLDHIWNNSVEGNSQEILPLCYNNNLLSATVGSAYFSNGVSGATCHGDRLGVPACSVWSMMKALYSRVLYALQTNDFVSPPISESTFRNSSPPTGFKPFVDALDEMLADNPSELTAGGTSKVQYHLARVSNQLEICSRSFFGDPNFLGNASDDRLRFTFPNVFLWDRSAYTAASAADKWKHLYVVGNGNVVYDSRSVAINKPYNFAGSTTLTADITGQDYRSSVIYLNEVNHQRGYIGDGTSVNHARMIVFNGSGGPTSDSTGTYTRRNATSKISLLEMPVCEGMTHSDDPDQWLSVCSICNAIPSGVCTQDMALAENCETVNHFPNTQDGAVIESLMCRQTGGLLVEYNSLTASYQI